MTKRILPEIPSIEKLNPKATLQQTVDKNVEIKNKIDICKDRLAQILTEKKNPSTKTERLSVLVDKVKDLGDVPPKVYGVRVDKKNSNQESCVSYIDDAIGIPVAQPTSLGDWATKFPFNKIRLVGFKNGVVTKEINPIDKTKYKDGEIIPDDVDVMVEIPKIYWSVTDSTNTYDIRISDTKINEKFDCFAHKVGVKEVDNIYIGAYLGVVEGGKLRSKSGVLPTIDRTIDEFRTLAQANGSGYQQMTWLSLVLLKILYLILYKNINSQAGFGLGYVNRENGSMTITGGTNTKGLVFAESTGKKQMCFLGVEDFVGNAQQFVDGMYLKEETKGFMITPDNKLFDSTGVGYKEVCKWMSERFGGNLFITDIAINNEGLFVPIDNGSGSTSTNYLGNFTISPGCASFSGNYNRNYCSIFTLGFLENTKKGFINSRLCYLG